MDWRNPKNDRARAAYDNFTALDGAVRRQRRPADQARPDRLPGARAGVAAVRRRSDGPTRRSSCRSRRSTSGSSGTSCSSRRCGRRCSTSTCTRTGARHARRSSSSPGATFERPLGGIRRRVERRARTQLARPRSGAGEPLRASAAWPGIRTCAPSASPTSGRASRSATTRGRQTVVSGILMDSWPAYERYTGPLGAGTLTDIINIHYGPGVESSERNGWGQWHRADEKGVGMDRTVATGTGYIGQYPAPVARDVRVARDVPRRAAAVHAPRAVHARAPLGEDGHSAHLRFALRRAPPRRRRFVERWRALEGRVDAARYRAVLAAPRVPGRPRRRVARRRVPVVPADVGHSAMRPGGSSDVPGRLEAEDAQLTGYAPVDVTPWETASQGKAVACAAAERRCAAAWRHAGAAGRVRPARAVLRRT